jgi:rRNA processing protein Gar1
MSMEKENPNDELQKIIDSSESLTLIFSKNMNEEEHPKSVYITATQELAQFFEEETIYEIFDKHLPSEYWSSLDESQRKTRFHNLIEAIKKQPPKLNAEIIKEKLEHIGLESDLLGRVKQALSFINSEILPTKGSVSEIEIIIDTIICPKFGFRVLKNLSTF